MKHTNWRSRILKFFALLGVSFLALPVFAQSNVFLPPIGGRGGGEFIALCNSPEFLIGFQLRTADDVDAIRPLCARIYGPTDIGPADNFRIYLGGDGGAEREIVCPSEKPIVTGLEIGYEGEKTVIVHSIHLFCGTASFKQQPNDTPSVIFDGPQINGHSGLLESGFRSVSSGRQFCPPGYLSLGIQGRSGIWVDAVGLICGPPKLTPYPRGSSPSSVSSIGRVKPTVPSIGKVTVPGSPAFIYAVKNDAAGTLEWFRHDGATTGKFDWKGPRIVNGGWSDFKHIFPGGDGRIYVITSRDTLLLYQHDGFASGIGRDDPGGWLAAQPLATGMSDVTHAFANGDGVIYTITTDGTLNWYRHIGITNGTGTLLGPNKVGRGWNNLKQVFSIGEGIIYAITLDGKIKWFKHNGYLNGTGLETPGAWIGPKEVGSGWDIYKQILVTGKGIFYGIAPDGKLIWRHHKGYRDGSMVWDGPEQVGTGWGELLTVFAQP